MPKLNKDIEKITADLFGSLFPAYDDRAYLGSMRLFYRRFKANKFPLAWFRGKRVLDAGCGSGRYATAASLIGAKEVCGIDISSESIKDARRRARDLRVTNVNFMIGSIEKIPLPDKYFDAVICSGVLHHTVDPEKTMAKISRFLRPAGMLYLLVYATGGIRWPLVEALRNLAGKIGFEAMDEAFIRTGLPVNKRRTYLDDLFVPVIDFYTWQRCKDMLQRHGFRKIKRWDKGRFDHEENLDAYYADLKGFSLLFKNGSHSDILKLKCHRGYFGIGKKICDAFVDYVEKIRREVKEKRISRIKAMKMVIGQGHHRVIAWKNKES